MDKKNVAYPYNRILYSSEKEQNTDMLQHEILKILC